MNLAEIRKKANREKEAGRAQQSTALAATVPAIPEAELREAAELLGDELFASEQVEAVESRVFLPPTSFDPIAILRAGRESAGCYDEIVDEMPEEAGAVTDEVSEMLRFRLGREEYVIDIMEIKEIIKPRDTTEIPHAPDFITGVLSLRGLIVPVFDLRLRLHMESSGSSGKERVIVVRNGDGYRGLLVDEVVQVVKIPVSAMENPPAVLDGIDREFVSGLGRFEGKMLIMLCLDKVLDTSLG